MKCSTYQTKYSMARVIAHTRYILYTQIQKLQIGEKKNTDTKIVNW